MAEHTKTPWDLLITENTAGWKPSSPTVTITAGDVLIATYITDYVEYPETDEENAANAAFIVNAVNEREALTRHRDELVEALEQAFDCIRGETPEDMTADEARADTIEKIRKALALTSAERATVGGE